MLSNVQRTKIESKSQQAGGLNIIHGRCYQMYKEQKLKANHNLEIKPSPDGIVVIKCTKNKNWKQITTINPLDVDHTLLLSNVQRTKIESKSQPGSFKGFFTDSCYQMYKEQKLKANHNRSALNNKICHVVIKCTKNKNWKQITTIASDSVVKESLLSNVQRTKIESKSQHASPAP